ncbi:MAG: hypothetical protein AAGC78_09150 [Cellvibrio sp.]|uniref:hypothetical protein n=1 Tax=Cellvibrio sp. TaxID=1965322 RepID=UPI0031A976D7
MKNIFQKTALALTIATMSAGAFAAVLDHTAGATEVVLANEVFGTGSEETLVAVPSTTFEVAATPGAILAGQVYTVKLTLNKGAVFGEDLSSLDKWEDAGVVLSFETTTGVIQVGGVGAGNTALNADVTSITVDQGGAIGDNTVTFKITAAANHQFDEAVVSQFRVKRLTSALARGVANPTVSLGAEFRNVTTAATDTAPALIVFRSQDGVELTTTQVTDYDDGVVGLRARIDVADVEKSFTGNLLSNTGTGAAQDFDETNNVSFVNLGNIFVNRTSVDAAWGGGLAKKENGDDFDFNGSDEIFVTINSTQVLDAYSTVYLRPGAASVCDATVTGADFDVNPATGATGAEIDLSGETTAELEAGYRVCAIASGDIVVPESTFSAALNVEYFNPRYTNSEDTLNYGPVLRNGCQITLFNLPNVNAADDAFLRITNVSEKPGAVRVSVWPETGGATTIDTNTVVVENLAAHATAVLHTAADQTTGVFLGSKLPAYGAVTSGRHRIVIQGAFPACEGMGLVRTPSGVLTNMTSTTYSGDESRLGQQNNGTSNTTN